MRNSPVALILSLSKDEGGPTAMSAWAYMLRCADGRFYVGSHRGEDPRAREAEHNAGYDPKAFTFKRRPVELVWAEHFEQITDAIAAQRQIKGCNRAKKEALTRGDWAQIQRLARSSPRPSTSSG